MKTYNPDKRAAEKSAARIKDEESLKNNTKTKEQLQQENGGYGIFKNSKLIR
tara:strand:- start:1426 stop:1581 length:156 start_codon:yes stop_codon:yes gene_type:complete